MYEDRIYEDLFVDDEPEKETPKQVDQNDDRTDEHLFIDDDADDDGDE